MLRVSTVITCISHGPGSWLKYHPKSEFLNFTVFIVDVDLSQMAEKSKNKGTLLSQTVKDGEKQMIL